MHFSHIFVSTSLHFTVDAATSNCTHLLRARFVNPFMQPYLSHKPACDYWPPYVPAHTDTLDRVPATGAEQTHSITPLTGLCSVGTLHASAKLLGNSNAGFIQGQRPRHALWTYLNQPFCLQPYSSCGHRWQNSQKCGFVAICYN